MTVRFLAAAYLCASWLSRGGDAGGGWEQAAYVQILALPVSHEASTSPSEVGMTGFWEVGYRQEMCP